MVGTGTSSSFDSVHHQRSRAIAPPSSHRLFLLIPIKRNQWIANATTSVRVVHLGLTGSVPFDGSRSADRGSYFMPETLGIKTAYCFAAANASDLTYGPSGVVCSSEDYKGVFQGQCTSYLINKGEPSPYGLVRLFLSFFLVFSAR